MPGGGSSESPVPGRSSRRQGRPAAASRSASSRRLRRVHSASNPHGGQSTTPRPEAAGCSQPSQSRRANGIIRVTGPAPGFGRRSPLPRDPPCGGKERRRARPPGRRRGGRVPWTGGERASSRRGVRPRGRRVRTIHRWARAPTGRRLRPPTPRSAAEPIDRTAVHGRPQRPRGPRAVPASCDRAGARRSGQPPARETRTPPIGPRGGAGMAHSRSIPAPLRPARCLRPICPAHPRTMATDVALRPAVARAAIAGRAFDRSRGSRSGKRSARRFRSGCRRGFGPPVPAPGPLTVLRARCPRGVAPSRREPGRVHRLSSRAPRGPRAATVRDRARDGATAPRPIVRGRTPRTRCAPARLGRSGARKSGRNGRGAN